uniref:Uncharacterized protein n=1 Tax=Fagus sylvatica TaxID=28930 RepID=A0A2N9J7N5_FAGSY
MAKNKSSSSVCHDSPPVSPPTMAEDFGSLSLNCFSFSRPHSQAPWPKLSSLPPLKAAAPPLMAFMDMAVGDAVGDGCGRDGGCGFCVKSRPWKGLGFVNLRPAVYGLWVLCEPVYGCGL